MPETHLDRGSSFYPVRTRQQRNLNLKSTRESVKTGERTPGEGHTPTGTEVRAESSSGTELPDCMKFSRVPGLQDPEKDWCPIPWRGWRSRAPARSVPGKCPAQAPGCQVLQRCSRARTRCRHSSSSIMEANTALWPEQPPAHQGHCLLHELTRKQRAQVTVKPQGRGQRGALHHSAILQSVTRY